MPLSGASAPVRSLLAPVVARSPDRATSPTEGLPLTPARRPSVDRVTWSGDHATTGSHNGEHPLRSAHYLPWCSLIMASICFLTASRLKEAGSCIGGECNAVCATASPPPSPPPPPR